MRHKSLSELILYPPKADKVSRQLKIKEENSWEKESAEENLTGVQKKPIKEEGPT